MKCPVCNTASLLERYTRQGAHIDRCGQCGGAWFDQGEILMFTRQPRVLDEALRMGAMRVRSSSRVSPRSGAQMETHIISPSVSVERCPSTGGYWVDAQSLVSLAEHGLHIDWAACHPLDPSL